MKNRKQQQQKKTKTKTKAFSTMELNVEESDRIPLFPATQNWSNLVKLYFIWNLNVLIPLCVYDSDIPLLRYIFSK